MAEESSLPFPVRGLSKGNVGESDTDATDETEEIILSPEQFAQQFGKVKVRYTVNGEEVVRDAPDILKRDQLYSGREGLIEERNSQSARLLQETQAIRDELAASKGNSVETIAEDSDDPQVFVDKRVEKGLAPILEKLNQLGSILGDLQPVVGEAQFKGGKESLQAMGIDVSDYDARRAQMLKVFETKVGRLLKPEEVSQIKSGLWSQAYLISKTLNPKTPVKQEVEKSKTKVTVTAIEQSDESNESLRRAAITQAKNPNLSRSLSDAISGKKTWAEHLSTKIKPMAPRTG